MKKTKTKIGLLTETETKEVSIVDRAANQRVFAVSKNKEENMTVLESVLGLEAEGEQQLETVAKDTGMSERGAEALTALYRLASNFSDELNNDAVQQTLKAAGIEFETAEVKEEEAAPMPVIKSEGLPVEVQKALELYKSELDEQKTKNEDLANALRVERSVRLNKEYTQKASDEFPNLGDSKAVGELLKDLNDLNRSMAERVSEVFKSANSQIESSGMLATSGSSNEYDVSGNAWETIEKAAQKLVEGGKFTSQEEAVNSIVQENGELYNAYIREQGGL